MRVLLIGDLHFFSLRLSLGEWFSKRVLGQINLLRNRRHQFSHGLFPDMLARGLAESPEAAVLTGDFTTTALEREFKAAQAALGARGSALAIDGLRTLAVPGNHDRYTFAASRKKLWEKFFSPAQFPKLEPLGGHWHALLLDSASPRALSSRGGLGKAQLDAAEKLLQTLRPEDGVLVVCHYPPVAPKGVRIPWNRDMAGRANLADMLTRCPARVVFAHGHIHLPWHLTPEKDSVPFDCINAGAPCQIKDKHGNVWPEGQGLWILELPEDARNGTVNVRRVGA